MEGNALGLIILRILQLIFAAVVLGVSVKGYDQIKDEKIWCRETGQTCVFGGFYPSIGYCAFVGAFGLVEFLVGVVAAVSEFIPWIVLLAIEGLTILFYLAGGIRMAVLIADTWWCSNNSGSAGHCRLYQTDTAFLFLGFIACLVAMGLCFMIRRANGGKLVGAV